MSFTEEWFAPPSVEYLCELVEQVAPIPGLIVEIGSWEGRSTCALANAAHPRMVHAVDTWEGSPGEISSELAKDRDVFTRWTQNIAELTKGNVIAHRMGWREYVPQIDQPIALAFIDAEHTYREVFDNVTALLPLMSKGGVLCGDDAGHPPVTRAVLDALPRDDVWVKASVWSWVKP